MTDNLHRLSRRSLLGLAGAALLLPRRGRAEAALETLSGAAFGTTWRITGPAGAGLRALRPDIEALFAEIDREMSPWQAGGALGRFNAAGAGWQAVGPEMERVTRAALEVAAASGGAFDPTVGPLVARWGFGPIAGGAPDWRGIAVAPGRIGKARADLTLDLCGIAKGRALDRAAALAAGAGQGDLLLDVGGELRALGRHPAGRDWQVAVEAPSGAGLPAVLRLPPGRAVATSGLAALGYAAGTRRYGHIIDAAAGAPADGGLGSVSVIAEDAMRADAWATALFAAGPEAGPRRAEEAGIAALFLPLDPGAAPVARAGFAEVLL